MKLVGNARSPQDCQKACQKSWGCDFFMTKVHNKGHCHLLNIWTLKQLIEMENTSSNYWPQFRLEDESEMVTLVGPRKCPDKKGKFDFQRKNVNLYYHLIPSLII